MFARLESPAELDFATHGVCSCKRYTRASAHNVARGYDDRAATTAALMCLLPGSRAHTRSQKSRAPQKPRGNVEGADTSPATRGLRRWRQDGGEATSKTPRSLASQASSFGTEGVLLERFFPRGLAVGTRRQAACAIWQAGAALLPALFYRLRGPLSSRFFKRSGQRIGFAASQCVQSTHNLKAQPGFEDCCAKNKSGYLRIRATAVKERIEAVTNGQGRQGREDLQDQARPRRRNRLPSARAVRGVPRSDRETSTRADGVATTRA